MAKNLLNLRTNARMILDEVSEADWTDSQINTELNWAYMEMYTAVIDTYEDYYRTISTSGFVADQSEYALPDNFFKIRRLESKYASTDDYVKVIPATFDQILRGVDNTSIGSTGRPIYELSGNFIRILPVPENSVSSALRMTYIKQIDELDDDTDEIEIPFPNRYGKYLVKGACAQLLSKGQQEEKVAQSYEAYFQIGLNKMKEELEIRYADGVKMIQDASGQSNDFTESRTGIVI